MHSHQTLPSTSPGSSYFLRGKSVGTSAVFLTSICTILGPILFLRLDFALANLGLLGGLGLLLFGHLVTFPTAMSIAEIATNQRVEGGREYYIISRSFGVAIGGAIGIALYLSQAMSAAFYVVAFAQAFRPVFDQLLASEFSLYVYDYRVVSVPAMALLVTMALTQRKVASIRMIYFVACMLLVALVFFLFGSTDYSPNTGFESMIHHLSSERDFFEVFAICFPAFTGITAGVGLSSNLKNPTKSIPRGTIYATLVGLGIYLLVLLKLYWSLPAEELVAPLSMQSVAVWGPIIPLGLGAATISSAIGSILVAPRTLQAIANDDVLPSKGLTRWLKRVQPHTEEPGNATIVTSVIAGFFVVFIGDIDIIAHILTISFLITYGGICSISFLEHFTADPSYRPAFRTRWYLSLLGAVASIYLLFRISPEYSLLAIAFMVLVYSTIRKYKEREMGITAVLQGLIFQLNRQLHIFLQKSKKAPEREHWRPSVVCVSDRTFDKLAAFDLLRWISYKYGFGTYIHRIEGHMSTQTVELAEQSLERMIALSSQTDSNVYVDTFVAPSFQEAVTAVVQLPGMSGKENNMIMFEFSKGNPERISEIVESFSLVHATGFDVCVLAGSNRNFGYKRTIDIYLTSNDLENANLMILMGFIMLGHPDWEGAKIRLLAIYPDEEIAERRIKILRLINQGRLPISQNNVVFIPKRDGVGVKEIINSRSKDTCLTIVGVREEVVKHEKQEAFMGYERIGDVLFVNAKTEKVIE